MHGVLDQLVPIVRERPEANLEEVASEGQRALLSVLRKGVFELLWQHRPVQAWLDVMDDMVAVIKRLLVLEVVDAVVSARHRSISAAVHAARHLTLPKWQV
jgi:hypothetical protein